MTRTLVHLLGIINVGLKSLFLKEDVFDIHGPLGLFFRTTRTFGNSWGISNVGLKYKFVNVGVI